MTPATDQSSPEFYGLIELVQAGVNANLSLIQIREKRATARTLFDLSEAAAKITTGSQTRLLVNDRADVAKAAGADGVHLTSDSLSTRVVRQRFGEDFLIGVSTHSQNEVLMAKSGGADFAVFGPVFTTPSKVAYGEPLGIDRLKEVVGVSEGLPILAIGGISLSNSRACFQSGAAGLAAIRLFSDPHSLVGVVERVGVNYREVRR